MAVKVKEKVKGSGEWWIFINHHGRRKSKKIGRDEEKAHEVARKVEAKLVLNDFKIDQPEKKILTFGEYGEIWQTVTLPATVRGSTAELYKGMLKNKIYPVFKNRPVTEITRMQIKTFLQGELNKGSAKTTVRGLGNVISGVLTLALDDGVISVNPSHRLGKLFDKSLHKDVNPLTGDELSLLLSSFREHYPKHYAMALTLARTGMRISEAVGLQWGDIDFHSRFITIQRGIRHGKLELPKNGKTRKIDMSNQLTDTFKQLKHARNVETVKKGWGQVPEWVFITGNGNFMDASTWRKKVFYKALDQAKLRRIRIHDLRHTYASLLIQNGESLAYVKDQLGHYSIKMTVDLYGHLAPTGNKSAVDRLDDTAPVRTLYAPG